MPEVEVQIDASRGAITVRGEQAFVTEVLDKYRSIFEIAQKRIAKPEVGADTPAVDSGGTAGHNALSTFSNVYDIEGDTVSILVSPPGKSMTAQAQALILLYLFARHKLNAEPVGAEQIKEQCKAHACFDSKNFSSHLKSQKTWITVTGANSSMTARLTVPGRKAAEDLATKLQAGE